MRHVLITGGSRGIGAALVRGLRRQGVAVTFTYCRHADAADELARATGAAAVVYDQASPEAVRALCSRLEQGDFDGLVNNAWAPAERRLLLKSDVAALLGYVTAHLAGALALSQGFARAVKARGGPGAIVNVLSSVTLGPVPAKLCPYVTAKYALLGLTRGLAAELVHYGIRVNAVSPGMTRTDFNRELPARFVEEYERTLPLRRLAAPEEVAAAVQFLLSDAAAYVHGVNLPVAGGDAC